ncbi:type II secretion system F family protein [Thermoflavimicrobium dichotomicum]|uniref:Tight adherence protein B n=1 Tax=Thermoflavimicrobium dichotomicum TaxID=46223 RepID=A0A1I3QQJ9_9BACL|nr:type II secretion system F family protein [Thermoflavimicrobium dichotomicum]SFJ36493.1 tight adherence protein B [Thermoflavimicrobium dichotomicum]
MLGALCAAGAMFFLASFLYFIWLGQVEKKQIERRLRRSDCATLTTSWSGKLADFLDGMIWAKRLAPQLKQAQLSLRPAEYGAILILLGLGICFLFSIGFQLPVGLGVFLAGVMVPFVSRIYLRSRKKAMIQKVNNQLAEVCRLLSSAVQAGLSIPQGLEFAAMEIDPPLRNELIGVVYQLRCGRDLESACRHLLRVLHSKDMELFVHAILMQWKTGGEATQVFGAMASMMEERKRIQQSIAATVAQARYSAYLLPVISLVILLFLSQMIEHFRDFVTSLFGISVLSIFCLMQGLGIYLIRRISNIKV